MARQLIRIPLRRLVRLGFSVYRIEFDLDVCSANGTYARVPFRLDSATDFTTIPAAVAANLNIPFTTEQPVFPNTAAGKASQPSYVCPMWFSFPEMPHLRFQSSCMFSPMG